jgi:hypothetical protein
MKVTQRVKHISKDETTLAMIRDVRQNLALNVGRGVSVSFGPELRVDGKLYLRGHSKLPPIGPFLDTGTSIGEMFPLADARHAARKLTDFLMKRHTWIEALTTYEVLSSTGRYAVKVRDKGGHVEVSLISTQCPTGTKVSAKPKTTYRFFCGTNGRTA